MKKRIQEYFNWKRRGDRMNPENSIEDFDLSDLEPKVEIGDELDLKADEAFADDASMGMSMGLRELLSVYGSGMRVLEENLKGLMKLEGFAEKSC